MYNGQLIKIERFSKIEVQNCEFNYNISNKIIHIPATNLEIPILVVGGQATAHMDTHIHISSTKFQNNIAAISLLHFEI